MPRDSKKEVEDIETKMEKNVTKDVTSHPIHDDVMKQKGRNETNF